MWKTYNINELDPRIIDVMIKRFPGQHVLLHELIDNDHYIVKQFFKPCNIPLDVINEVIVKIKYPLTSNRQPTDFHYFQAFRKWLWRCHKTFRNDFDFWQFASETAWLKMGDCEDSSILTGAGLQNMKTPYYIVFGKVWHEGKLLGLHAWVVFEHEGSWKLAETTLDSPYYSYHELPSVDITHNRWPVGSLIYEGLVMFNKKELKEWVEGSKVGERLREYMLASHKEKENIKKYKEMNKVYKLFWNKKLKVG